MNHEYVNRVSLVILGSILGLLILISLSNAIISPKAPEVAATAPAAAPAAAVASNAAPAGDLPALLVKASATKGGQDAKICEACHNITKGGGPKIGPDLWGVVGRKIASMPGFEYSDSIKKLSGDWTYAKLNEWITDPKALAADTKMTFPGEKSEHKRADILAFLQTLSDKPVAFPAAAGVASAAVAAPTTAGGQLPGLLATADLKKGEHDAKVCEACHNVTKGGGPKIGPDLWGVVGRKVASMPGFDYSDSIKKVGGDWTYEKLNKWITDPKAMAADTKMTFPGEKSAHKRADILAYLRTLSDSPVPFPK